MSAPHILGHFERHPTGILEGWCWSPDMPQRRWMVEILADARVLIAAFANRPLREIAPLGLGDGAHGFRFAPDMLQIPPDAHYIWARERESSRVLGRRPLRHARSEDPRLAALTGAIDTIHATISATPPRAATARALRDGFGIVATRLAGADPIEAARLGLSRMLASVALPIVATPRASLVLVVHDARAAARRIRDLAISLAGTDTELLIVDTGRDAATPLLAACLPAVTFLRANGDAGRAAVAALARGVARSDAISICVVGSSMIDVS